MSRILRQWFVLSLFVFFAAAGAQAKSVPAYFTAPYHSVGSVKSALNKSGLQVLATYHPAGKGYLNVILYTNASLKRAAAKPKRGFAAVQRVLVNSKAKTVLATNPEYWLRAFLQGQYKPGMEAPVTRALGKALGKLSPSKDALPSGKLAKYHFMFGMPYYDEMITLKKGKHFSVANRVFTLSLPNGSKVVGVRMPRSVESFISKIGEDKALVLPYMVLLEKGEALMLNPKYYLAISYPRLSMGQFMKISDIPGKIEKALKNSIK
ncbi:hypothetical protein [Nitratifractor salsuginis]|uniref:DUF302 domain-containing protein n=1 Tax=Nitratifractor salsuginis (strain DSM 16511 / JCM 12458 / E9I37-1) TaxID=749222 RepID=E6X2D3_NITSE|nr:hypothetical protein [Nitratifractor salsuginis]ADV46068.1 hypothetical protein Nitsa_0806 [Nitratifractor salsuginis DSM 16511]